MKASYPQVDWSKIDQSYMEGVGFQPLPDEVLPPMLAEYLECSTSKVKDGEEHHSGDAQPQQGEDAAVEVDAEVGRHIPAHSSNQGAQTGEGASGNLL